MTSMTITPSQNGVIVVLKQEDAGNEVLTFNSRTAFYRFLDTQLRWQKRQRKTAEAPSITVQEFTSA